MTDSNSPQNSSEQTDDDTELRLAFYIEKLETGDVAERWKAAESLARLGDDRGIDPLLVALQDEDWRVRQKSAWALGQLGDSRAIEPLLRAMRHERDTVREIMEEAVNNIRARMRGEAIPELR